MGLHGQKLFRELTFPAKVFIGGVIKNAVRNGAGAFYAEFAFRQTSFYLLRFLN